VVVCDEACSLLFVVVSFEISDVEAWELPLIMVDVDDGTSDVLDSTVGAKVPIVVDTISRVGNS